jgi:hypothetical protein
MSENINMKLIKPIETKTIGDYTLTSRILGRGQFG